MIALSLTLPLWSRAPLALVAAILWALIAVRVTLVVLRISQLEEYSASRVWRWANVPAWNWHRALITASCCVLVAGGVAIVIGDIAWAGLGGVAAGVVANLSWRWPDAKKATVWTPRMRRLGTAVAVELLAATTAIAVIDWRATDAVAAVVTWFAFFMLTTLAVLFAVLANLLLMPVEATVRRGFLRRARRRVAEVDPDVVVITGSWGKTSTKHILAQLLDPGAAALPTPKSFNTLMGVTRTINDSLEFSHRTFLVEADAYARGEIRDICALARPDVAVVTAVGAQHLERFATVDEIADALYEAVEALDPDGVAVIHAGEERCAALAERSRADGHPTVTYAAEDEGVEADVIARDIAVTGNGSRFRWEWPAMNLAIDVEVSVLGRHQVLNVSAALAVIHLLGYDVARAARRAHLLTHVEHRLQPIDGGNGVTVIDDSYNANPVGVHNGLDVLASLGAGRKILVTPGLVELGAEETQENRRYGEHAATVCDHVVVVKARTTDALLSGLRAGGLDETAIHVVGTLAEATTVIGTVAGAGDVVLFANDLPDTYL